MGQLDGRTALVTGGSRGIGAAIAKRLVADGAHVAITYARTTDHAHNVVDDLRKRGGQALAVQAEATDVTALCTAVDTAAAAFGRLDVLVNNAGIAPFGPFEDVTVEDVDEAMAIHGRAAFVLAQAAVPHMRNGGRVVNIGSSLVERVPYPGWTLYAMSKSALTGLTKGLARDLGPRGITVNLVHPGSTDTDMNPANSPEADEERRYTALGRYLEPEDIAATVAHLAGESGRNITGATFVVDAGMAA